MGAFSGRCGCYKRALLLTTLRMGEKMNRKLFLIAAVVLGCLWAGAAFAADTPEKAQENCQPSAAMTADPFEFAAFYARTGTGKDRGKDGDQEASCSALCENGSSVTCYGTSCSATDNTCSGAGYRGSCWGSSTGTKYCAVCSLPSCDLTCPGRSCSNNSDCHNGSCPQGVCQSGECRCLW